MAKKRKSGLVALVKNAARRKADKRKNPASYSLALPDMGLVGDVAVGAVAFAATTVPVQFAANAMKSKWGDTALVRNAPPLMGGVMFLVYWLLASKVKALRKYQAPILIGSGIAVLNLALKAWFPRVAWLLGGATPLELGPGSMGNIAPGVRVMQKRSADIAYLPSGDDERDLAGDDDDLMTDEEDDLYQGSFKK